MAHIVDTLAKHFTGHVGPVRFENGHAECADPDLLDYFRGQPDRYLIESDEDPQEQADQDGSVPDDLEDEPQADEDTDHDEE